MNADRLTRRLALCVTVVMLSPTSRAQSGMSDSEAFALAMADYQRQHYAAAYQALWRLADQGHGEAARIALPMAVHGPRLYGMQFAIGPVQRARWLAAALPHADETALVLARRNPR